MRCMMYHPALVFLVQSLIRTLTSFKDYTGSLVLAVRMAKLSPVIKLVNKFWYWMVKYRAFSCSFSTNVNFCFHLVFLKKQFIIFRVFLSDVCLVSSDNFVVLSLQRTWHLSPHVSRLVRLKDDQCSTQGMYVQYGTVQYSTVQYTEVQRCCWWWPTCSVTRPWAGGCEGTEKGCNVTLTYRDAARWRQGGGHSVVPHRLDWVSR